MTRKKQNDATRNLLPSDQTQILPRGTMIGLLSRRQVEGDMTKVLLGTPNGTSVDDHSKKAQNTGSKPEPE